VLLSLRNRLSIALFPTRIVLTLTQRGWRPRSAQPIVLSFDATNAEPSWHGSLAVLRQWLTQHQQISTDVEVVLSDSWVKYAALPWSDQVQNPAEMAEFARLHFESLFGVSAADWDMRTHYNDYQMAGIGCGLHKELLADLKELSARHHMRLKSVKPYFINAFNQWRNRIKRDALVAFVEPGHCVLAILKKGAWHSVRNMRLGSESQFGLAAIIERETLVQGLDDSAEVYLHAISPISTIQLKHPRKIHLLEANVPAKRYGGKFATALRKRR
jgi:hypothetical protein